MMYTDKAEENAQDADPAGPAQAEQPIRIYPREVSWNFLVWQRFLLKYAFLNPEPMKPIPIFYNLPRFQVMKQIDIEILFLSEFSK